MICYLILFITFLNNPEIIFLHAVKWFQVLLYNSHNLTVICLHKFKWIYMILFYANDKDNHKDIDTTINIRESLNKFPDFFRMGTFIDSTYMKL